MAKCRLYILWLFGLFCFVNILSGEEYAPDPSLEDIKKMDAQEGLPRGAKRTPTVNTNRRFLDYVPEKDEDVYEIGKTDVDILQDYERDGRPPKIGEDNRSQLPKSRQFKTTRNRNKDFNKRETEETAFEEVEFEDLPSNVYTNEQEMEPPMERELTNNESNVYEPENEELLELKETELKQENENEIEESIDNYERIDMSNKHKGEEVTNNGDIDLGLSHERTAENTPLTDKKDEVNDELLEVNEFESENEEERNNPEESSNEETEEISKEERNEDSDHQNDIPFTDVYSNIDVPEYLREIAYYKKKDTESPTNPIPPENVDPICYLPPKTGFCRAYFQRFYYNHSSGECEQFIYGGCGGNDNNFKTLDECQQKCSQTDIQHNL